MKENKPEFKQTLTEDEVSDLTNEITLVGWTNKRMTVMPFHKHKLRVYSGNEVYFCGNFIDVAVKAYNEL